jgi:hypothetical protein
MYVKNLYDKKYWEEHKLKYRPNYGKSKRFENWKFGEEVQNKSLQFLKGASNINSFYDLDWNGKKIDVKAAHLRNGLRGNRKWTFDLRQKGKVDYFLIFCYEGDFLKYQFLIPNEELKIRYLTISKSRIDKYLKYLIN